MKFINFLACCAIPLFSFSPAFAATKPWEAPYQRNDATGAQVIGLWHFDADAPSKDASGHGHDLTLRGKDSHFVANGKFGGALEVDDKTEINDVAQGAAAKGEDELNPKGAFTVELWMSPDEKLTSGAVKNAYSFLVDKKYYIGASPLPEANTGYFVALLKAGDKFTVQAQLGFGKDSATIDSAPQSFVAGQWYHIALTYDGNGRVILYNGDSRIGEAQLEGRGAVTPGTQPFVIGDRVGSTGQRFYGRIDEVRLLNKAERYLSGKVLLQPVGGRSAFYRMEKNANVRMKVFNDRAQPLRGASVQMAVQGVPIKSIPLPELQPDKSTFVTVPLNVSLRPDNYDINAIVKNASGKVIGDAFTFPLTIVPRVLPGKFPVVLWANSEGDYKGLKDVGYTGELVFLADYPYIWKNGDSSTAMPENAVGAKRNLLDEMLATQVDALADVSPGAVANTLHPEFNRKDREGKTIDNTDGLYPEIQNFSYNSGAAVARSYGDMPSLKGALLQSEIRDYTAPSFNEIDKKAYRDFSGQDIPSQISSARGVSYRTLPDFPASRIIAENHPILNYYKWFWTVGDGWNTLNSKVADGLASTGRNDLLTWYDPAVRVPSIYGSGGNVKFLNHWTYTYPNPLDVGLATDELFAMAGGHPGQKVMNMIQIIWYRSQTTGTPVPGQEKEWEKATPDAPFISIAPDHLSEGMWLELARPVQAIANHGWGSLGDHLGFKQGSYFTTNVETRKRMQDMLQNVVKPLQPALKQVPDRPTDVAFLQSFASQMLANRGTYGSGGGWGAESYMIARYAGLQPQIVYDQTIEQKGLDQFKVLFLTNCDVLTQGVADAIRKFQRRGGIVIGDEFLAPGISPDILLKSIARTTPDATKASFLQMAASLRSELDPYYQLPIESSNPEVITRLRQFGNSQYVFVANDHRTYGDYVGQYKMVMEKGLPSKTQITLNAMSSGAVYDLTKHKQVSTTKVRGKVQFGVDLDGGGGNVFLVTNQPIGKMQVSASSRVKRGTSFPVKVLLRTISGKALNAVVPLKVTILDSKNRVAEMSGFYGAINGELRLNLNIASNDVIGKWQVEVTEALTGQKVLRNFAVN